MHGPERELVLKVVCVRARRTARIGNTRSLATLSLAGMEPTNIAMMDHVPADVLALLGEERSSAGRCRLR